MTLRERADAHRARGNEYMAGLYEQRIAAEQRLEHMAAQEVRKTVRVRGVSYRVVLNFDDDGGWYASAHGRSDVLPAVFESGHTSREACLAAVRGALRKQGAS